MLAPTIKEKKLTSLKVEWEANKIVGSTYELFWATSTGDFTIYGRPTKGLAKTIEGLTKG
jgi:hypothetical protein